MEEDFPLSYFPRCRGLTSSEQDERRQLYGENSIRIHLTPIFVLFFREVLSPFYIFQVFSCALWFYDDYYYYASCIVLLSAISIAYSLFTIRKVSVYFSILFMSANNQYIYMNRMRERSEISSITLVRSLCWGEMRARRDDVSWRVVSLN